LYDNRTQLLGLRNLRMCYASISRGDVYALLYKYEYSLCRELA